MGQFGQDARMPSTVPAEPTSSLANAQNLYVIACALQALASGQVGGDWAADNASAGAAFAGCILGAHAAHEVTLVAQVPIDIQRVNTTTFMSIPAGSLTLGLLANTNEISIRRTDLSAVASVVGFTWRG
jgi:hypothetical protein